MHLHSSLVCYKVCACSCEIARSASYPAHSLGRPPPSRRSQRLLQNHLDVIPPSLSTAASMEDTGWRDEESAGRTMLRMRRHTMQTSALTVLGTISLGAVSENEQEDEQGCNVAVKSDHDSVISPRLASMSVPISPLTPASPASPSARRRDRESLHRVLKNPTLYPMFLSYAESQYAAENVLFHKRTSVVQSMQQALTAYHYNATGTAAPPEIISELQMIYDEFVALTAPKQINVSVMVRKEMERQFASPDKALTLTVFDPAREEIFEMMFRQLYPGFVKTHPGVDGLIGAVTVHGVMSEEVDGIGAQPPSPPLPTNSQRFLAEETARESGIGGWVRRMSIKVATPRARRVSEPAISPAAADSDARR